MNKKIEVWYKPETNTFHILAWGDEGGLSKATYNTNVLGPALGYWSIRDSENDKWIDFMDYREPAEQSLKRLKEKFPGWEIIISEIDKYYPG